MFWAPRASDVLGTSSYLSAQCGSIFLCVTGVQRRRTGDSRHGTYSARTEAPFGGLATSGGARRVQVTCPGGAESCFGFVLEEGKTHTA